MKVLKRSRLVSRLMTGFHLLSSSFAVWSWSVLSSSRCEALHLLWGSLLCIWLCLQLIAKAHYTEEIQPERPQFAANFTHVLGQAVANLAAERTLEGRLCQRFQGNTAVFMLEHTYHQSVLDRGTGNNGPIDDEQAVGIAVLNHMPLEAGTLNGLQVINFQQGRLPDFASHLLFRRRSGWLVDTGECARSMHLSEDR
jgi:hypothetical protein